ncbi:LysR family transcriptional regulator, partial [Mesorhizobium sp. M8A.F.Ca.ET.023.02.2.1]
MVASDAMSGKTTGVGCVVDNVDLNLLVALDVLLAEGSVTG